MTLGHMTTIQNPLQKKLNKKASENEAISFFLFHSLQTDLIKLIFSSNNEGL